jgi:sigma-B regulation protein RsbU (phosphoserine phosphatase)
MLPRTFPPNEEWPDVEIYARMEPAREVGGDYYDFFRVDDDHIGVLIADVSGKGVPAGLFMMRTRAHVHSLAQGNLSAADAIRRVNRLIAPDNPSVMFVTMSYFIFDCRTGRVVFCNAGHNPPILLHNGKAQYLAVEEGHGHGMAVGVMEDAPYSDAEIQLQPGDSLVLYTDGITEPVDAEGVMFGEDRLLAEVEQQAHQTNRDNCDRLFDVVFSHQQGQEQFDDMTILFFKYSGTSDSNNPGGA